MDSPQVIKGIAGTRVTKIKQGTLKWRWDDNEGKTHTFLIPQSYFVPTGGVRLLSPQHWAQHLRSKPNQEGVTTTYKNKVVVTWQGCTKTVQLDDKTNVASFNLSPGYTKFQAFCAECGEEDEDNPVTFPTMVSDDEESVQSDQKLSLIHI